MSYVQLLAFEQYRWDVVSQWPDSERKRTTLAAIRRTIESLQHIV